MRIVFVIPSVTNYFTFLHELSLELESKGHQIYVISSSKHIIPISEYGKVVVGEFFDVSFIRGFGLMGHLKTARVLEATLNKIQPDIVNIHFSAAIFTYSLMKRNCNWTSIGMVHGALFPAMPFSIKSLILKIAEWWSYDKVDLLEVLSKMDENALGKLSGKIKVRRVPGYGLGCDLDVFNPNSISAKRKNILMAKFGINAGDFVFVFTGRQTFYKGFGRVVKAFLKLNKEFDHLHLILIGEKDNIHPTGLNRKETQLLKNPKIHGVGWKTKGEEIAELFSISNCNVFPSDREGMPINLMEAAVMGLPSITTDVRGCNEIIQHNVNGIILKKNTDENLYLAMKDFIQNPELGQRLGQTAYAERNKFDRNLFINDQVTLFESYNND